MADSVVVLNMTASEQLLLNQEDELERLVLDEESAAASTGGGCYCTVVDVVEKDNTNAVQSGAVYNHVAEQVGNIEILLGTI